MLKSTVMLMYKGLCSTDSSSYEQEFNPSVFHILDTWRRSFILSLFSSLPWSRLWKIIVYLATSADGLTTRIFCISTLVNNVDAVVQLLPLQEGVEVLQEVQQVPLPVAVRDEDGHALQR